MTTQTTGEFEERSVTDTVALRLLCWIEIRTHASLAPLHAPQVRVLTTYTTVAIRRCDWCPVAVGLVDAYLLETTS